MSVRVVGGARSFVPEREIRNHDCVNGATNLDFKGLLKK